MASTLREAIDEFLSQGKTQIELAKTAGVAQSTVSRLRRRTPLRGGKGNRRLCDFMQQEGYLGGPSSSEKALRAVWDGSENHDEALARLILATTLLHPDPDEEITDDA